MYVDDLKLKVFRFVSFSLVILEFPLVKRKAKDGPKILLETLLFG